MRFRLNTPYAEKDEAKALGARWNWQGKFWYYDGDELPEGLKRWYPDDNEPTTQRDALPLAPATYTRTVIVPAMDLSGLTQQQRLTVETTEGPVLVIAGPGTGKTHTLVKRLLYLVTVKDVPPEEIMVVTFTEKAAKEIKTRIYNGLFAMQEEGQLRLDDVHVEHIRVGTFHQLFLEILMDNLGETEYDKNLQQIDEYEQKEFVLNNIAKFKAIPGFDENNRTLFRFSSDRSIADSICGYVNDLREELISLEEMEHSGNRDLVFLAKAVKMYNELMLEINKIDFSGMLTETYSLFENHPEILQRYQEEISYIMVDEYQDTNLVQEKLVLMLGGSRQNICVVGDDDQSLYRFRGANVSNILDFENRFEAGRCHTFRLEQNFRSPRGIVNTYNKWMNDEFGCASSFAWDRARLEKTIVPHNDENWTSVIKCEGSGTGWYESIYNLIKGLKDSGKVTNYNQVVFLAGSTKDYRPLIEYLEAMGIDTYAPRYGLFFDREEVKGVLGCLIKCMPLGEDKLRRRLSGKRYLEAFLDYCNECIAQADRITGGEENPLREWVLGINNEITGARNSVPFSFSDLIYQMLEYEPFHGYITPNVDDGVFEERPARNISTVVEFVKKYEISKNIGTSIEKNSLETLWFNFFTYYLFNFKKGNNAKEYEDDSEYAPSGCVSFMTIHQSKGMEFPVVITALGKRRDHYSNYVKDEVLPEFREREDIEPEDLKDIFDYWRLYYTAFSRAQSLLVLAVDTESISPYSDEFDFRGIYEGLPEYCDADLSNMEPKEVKNVDLRQTYSFTSHLGVYDTCPKQYYFYKDLGYTSNKSIHAFFGTLVHETIEDIHKKAIAGNANEITHENVEIWFARNYNSLKMSENTFLTTEVLENAKEQVLRYVDNNADNWDTIRETEVEISAVKPEYILLGKVDLVQGIGDTYELVDFKTGKKPDPQEDTLQLRHYKEQLITYAHLISEKTGQTISRAHLYYPGVEEGDPRISFDVTQENTEETLRRFDEIVSKIQNKDFSGCAEDVSTCRNCDFKYYCHEDNSTPASRIRLRRNEERTIPLPLYGYVFKNALPNGQVRRPNFHTHLDCEKLYNKPVTALNVFQSVGEARTAGYYGYCPLCKARDEEEE